MQVTEGTTLETDRPAPEGARFVEASITAVPFFKLHGFKWARDDEFVIGGVSMKVFIMETHLDKYFYAT